MRFLWWPSWVSPSCPKNGQHQLNWFWMIALLVWSMSFERKVILQVFWRDAIIWPVVFKERLTESFKRRDVFNELVIKSFEWVDVSNEQVTKSFQRVDASNERVTKPFDRANVSSERVTKPFQQLTNSL